MVAFAAVLLGWLSYLALIPREKVPKKPYVFSGWMLAASVLSISPFVVPLGLSEGSRPLSLLLAIITLLLSLFFFFLLSQAPMPDGSIQCHEGKPLPPFDALDTNGSTFASSELQGQAFLLKFFRGHW